MTPRKPLEQRFWAKVDKTDDCWLWTGASWNGYGRIGADYNGVRSIPLLVHRVSYELAYGTIPDGHIVHHECGVRSCVNPDHLTLVSSVKEHGLLHRKQSGPSVPRKADWDIILAEFPVEELDKEMIRKMVADGVSQAAIARKLGISRQRIFQIVLGLRY